ncbi:MAG: DMT family transporter [Alphaproteobacteria bacterium]|nr:DMT family transporter [Alphaproteobacteria bacterium]MCK5621622.1 DMT family transporter [Alphaproteobacteria bacterium]
MTADVDQASQAGSNGRAYLLLAFTTFCWGANALFGRLAVGEISPMALVTARWLGVSLILAIFAHRHVLRNWPALRPHLLFVSILGVTGFTAFNSLFYVAAHSTTAVNIGIIQGSLPMFVLIGAFAVYRTAVTRLQVAGVLSTLIGVVIVASGGDPARLAALAINFGDILMVVACALYAAYTLGLRKRPPASALGLFAVMAFAAFMASLPLAVAEVTLGQFQWPTATGWIIVALVTLFPSLLAQIAFIQGVALIGPARAGVFVNLVPVYASIMAVAFLGEPFELYHAIALGLVLGGIWLSERGKAG